MAETLKLTNRQLRTLAAALNSLDGIRRGKDDVEPYEFEDGVQWNISKNTVLVERAREPYEHAVKALLKTHGVVRGEVVTEANRDRLVAFQAAVEGLDDGEVEISGILLLTLDQLRGRPARGEQKAGKNLITVSVLKGLNPIIKETTRPD